MIIEMGDYSYNAEAVLSFEDSEGFKQLLMLEDGSYEIKMNPRITSTPYGIRMITRENAAKILEMHS